VLPLLVFIYCENGIARGKGGKNGAAANEVELSVEQRSVEAAFRNSSRSEGSVEVEMRCLEMIAKGCNR
jgi:hypothetical protein